MSFGLPVGKSDGGGGGGRRKRQEREVIGCPCSAPKHALSGRFPNWLDFHFAATSSIH